MLKTSVILRRSDIDMSMRNSRLSLIFVYLVLAALLGCSTQPVHLDDCFSTDILHYDVAIANSFRLLSTKDVRRNKRSLGRVACRNVKNEHVLTWLTQGFQAIGIPPGDPKQINQNIIGVHVSLMMLYARSIETSMSCNVVLKVRFSRDGSELKQAVYRGNHICLNWASGEGEIDACFDQALTNALEPIQADMMAIKQMRRP